MLSIKTFLSIFLIFTFYLSYVPIASSAIVNNNPAIFASSKLFINFIEIKNFDRVDENYYRGGQPNNYDLESLSRVGIKTIINLRSENPALRLKERIKVEKLGMKYVSLPMTACSPPTDSQIKQFFTILSNPKNLPVYVHCRRGKDRTGIMTALYRINKYGWTFNAAYSEMKNKGYSSILFPRQKRFLANYVSLLQDNNLYIESH